MLSDRPYMREEFGAPRWPANTILMVSLVVAFVVQAVLTVHFQMERPIRTWLALSDLAFARVRLWQLVTYSFLHGGLLHLFFNLIGLFFFGRAVESLLGRNNFLWIYFASVALGGLLQGLLGLLAPKYFGGFVVGASAGVCGLLAAFCRIEPRATILLFFIIPVQARYILWFSLFIAAFFVLVPADPGIGHAAHLGGLLTGLAYLHWGFHSREFPFHFNFQRLWRRRTPRADGYSAGPSERGLFSGASSLEEVDAILDKINEKGIHSLTERERRILENARTRLER